MVNYSNLKQSKSSTTVTSEGKLLHKIDTTVLLGPLDDPEKVAECFRLIWNTRMINEQEEIYAIYVDADLKIIEYRNLFRGGLSSVTFYDRVAIRYALLNKAHAVFLAHNHPNGSLTPSVHDKQTTAKFIHAAGAFDIKVLDHIIITSDSYFSFVEGGILNNNTTTNNSMRTQKSKIDQPTAAACCKMVTLNPRHGSSFTSFKNPPPVRRNSDLGLRDELILNFVHYAYMDSPSFTYEDLVLQLKDLKTMSFQGNEKAGI